MARQQEPDADDRAPTPPPTPKLFRPRTGGPAIDKPIPASGPDSGPGSHETFTPREIAFNTTGPIKNRDTFRRGPQAQQAVAGRDKAGGVALDTDPGYPNEPMIKARTLSEKPYEKLKAMAMPDIKDFKRRKPMRVRSSAKGGR